MNKKLDKSISPPYNETAVGELTALSDDELCEKARLGDEFSEETLVYRYTQWVRVCARSLFLAGADHEDLVQEGMIGLLSAIRHYDVGREASFSVYAVRCVKNRMIAAVRSAGREKHSALNQSVSLEALSFSDQPVGDISADPEATFLSKESRDEFETRLTGILSHLERQILGLYLEGLSYRDISLKLNKDLKSVDNAIQRIRRKLAGQNFWRYQE